MNGIRNIKKVRIILSRVGWDVWVVDSVNEIRINKIICVIDGGI